RLLQGTNDLAHYETWQLWGPSGIGLDNDARRVEHVDLVFARQQELSATALAPTLALDSPSGLEAEHALRTAQIARSVKQECGQSLAGRRSFWRAGPDLDAFV